MSAGYAGAGVLQAPRVLDVNQLLRSGSFEALVEAGLFVQRQAGCEDQAALLLRRACELEPEHEDDRVHFALARIEKDPKLQIQHAKRRAEIKPDAPYAWLMLGNMYDDQGNLEEALSAYRKGIEHDPKQYTHFVSCCRMLERLGRGEEALQVAEQAVAVGTLNHRWQRPSHFIPGLRAQAWWDEASSWRACHVLEDNFATIQDEVLALFEAGELLKQGMGDTEGLVRSGTWKELSLIFDGVTQASTERQLPKTVKLVEAQIPEAASMVRGATKLSVLLPGTRVKPHHGPSNTRMRIHLGIRIPDGAYIRAGDPEEPSSTRQWREGKCLCFDDSFRHEVWHDGAEPRIVLIVDVWHPDMDHKARLAACGSQIASQRYLARYSLAQQSCGWE
eukprot:TRINITY_DN97452_c0_g1_i1.p1 TRINITY_DN97452_c0_g1~~TRINITY_DN97452_c0_g1_i1.p1  ORF type:complete len:391 (+),score=75.21 TRINITY_DN97452_c0_g1_i1:37-1209(+)